MARATKLVSIVTLLLVGTVAVIVRAQQPAAPRPAAEGRTQTPTGPVQPPLFFSETWRQTGPERAATPDVVTNPNLELHLYGASAKDIQIAPAVNNARQDPPNLWTGICTTPVAATLRDKNNYVDLTGRAKIRWATRSAGFHVVRPVLKLADGTWLIGDHADGDGGTENFLETEFAIASVRWLTLDIANVVTVHADRAKPPEVGRWVQKPDLSRVDEVGFADLMPGSGHGWAGFVNVGHIDVYGRPVKR
jgi:hypothetical protein